MRLPLVLAAMALVAGCVGSSIDPASVAGSVSQPIHVLEDGILERVTTNAADGTLLDMAVWRPDTTEKVPVIVDIGPYHGLDKSIMDFDAIDLRLAEYFVPRGYAVVRGSVRGTGESEGCFDLGGETERQDVATMVQFLGDQPWSNGNVAAFGKSYDGTTPWMAAIEQPPALKTIVPISGITDWYRYMFYDGVAYPEEVLFNTNYYLYVDHDMSIPGPDGGDPQLHNDDAMHHVQKNLLRACNDVVAQTLPQAESTITGDHDLDFWLERDYERLWDRVDVPVFMVHGLQDWNVKPDNELPMYASLDVPKALWAGQWAHDYPDINRFQAEWSRHDWNETLLTWFDHYLKGIEDNGWEDLLHVEVQDQTGTWRNWTTWPPAEVVEATIPLPSFLTASSGATFGGPFSNVLTYRSGELTEDVLVSGAPVVDLTISSNRPIGHVTVKLLDEAPDGTIVEVDHGARDIRHREGRGTGSPAPIGSPFAMNVTLYPQEILFAAGHRIVLVLAAEDPDWWVASPSVGVNYVLDSGASALRLPVSQGVLAFEGDAPAPADQAPRASIRSLETFE